MDILSVAGSVLGLFAIGGWVLALGHLLVHFFSPRLNRAWLVLAAGYAATTVIVGVGSVIIPFVHDVTLVLGLFFVLAWAFVRPPLPSFPVFNPRDPFFLVTVAGGVFYAAYFVLTPDRAFDSLSYHIPFVREFVSTGQIGIPAVPINWVDHAHAAFPHGVEIGLGVVQQLVPSGVNLFHLLVLVAIVLGLRELAELAGIKDGWKVTALYVATPAVLVFGKMFYVELSIFLWLLAFLYIIWQRGEFPSRGSILAAIFGLALGLAKLNTLSYVGAVALVAIIFAHNRRVALAGAFACGAGLVFFISTRVMAHVSFFNELQIVQALSFSDPVSFSTRFASIAWSFYHYVLFTPLGVGLALAPLMVLMKTKPRWLPVTALACVGAFVFVFGATSLYHFTYTSFGMYAFAFVGVGALLVVQAQEALAHHASRIVRVGARVLFVGILVTSFIQVAALSASGVNGASFDSARSIPRSRTTFRMIRPRLFFS